VIQEVQKRIRSAAENVEMKFLIPKVDLFSDGKLGVGVPVDKMIGCHSVLQQSHHPDLGVALKGDQSQLTAPV
jgi:hypothetical protein